MQVLSNLTFPDAPQQVGRWLHSLNTSDLARVIPDSRKAAARNGVLMLDDEATLDGPDGVPLIRAAVAAACRTVPTLVYARPRQAQYPITDFARATASKIKAGRLSELASQPETAALDRWRAANDADRAAGLFDGVAATCVEYRLYRNDSAVEPVVRYTVAEQRRLGLPVAALLQPRYPDYGGIEPKWAGQWVPRDRMRELLWWLAAERVDYVVLWHGQPEPRTPQWDDFLADVAGACGTFEGWTR